MKKILAVTCFALLSACSAPTGSGGGGGGGGGTADAGNSPECTRTSDCANNERCVENVCVEQDPGCQSDNDCNVGEACQAGECVEVNTNGCTTDADCADGQVCDANQCKSTAYGSCTTDDDCAGETRCNLQTEEGTFCGLPCADHNGCANWEMCHPQAGACVPNACETPNEACDGHGTADGLCLSFGQNNICVVGAGNGAGCAVFGDGEACEAGMSCRIVSITADNTFCGAASAGQLGAACEAGLLAGGDIAGTEDCAQGSACVATRQGSVCLGLCRVGHDEDCAPLQGTDTTCQAATSLFEGLQSSPWGLCLPPRQG